MLAVGGDQGDLAALPVAAPGARLGGLAEGEAAIYGADGSRVHVKRDGTIEVTAAKGVDIVTPHAQLHLTEAGLTGRFGEAEVEFELSATRVRGRVGGSRFSASAAAAKLHAGGHFFAATPGGLVVSGPAAVSPDPDPDG